MIKKVFTGSEMSNTSDTELECYLNSTNEVFISIVDTSCDHNWGCQLLCLDYDTAKELSEDLKGIISMMEAGGNE